MGCCDRAGGAALLFLRRLGIGSAREVAAAAPLVGVQGLVVEGVHDRPGDVGVAGGLGPGRAERDLPAVSGAALDRQEGLGDIGPAGVPLDAARLDDILGLEYQPGFCLEAVVDLHHPWVEVLDQVEHAIADAGRIDADVLHVEALGDLLDLGGLERERLSTPAVLFQDPELAAWIVWRGDHDTRRVVPGSARVVADPDGAIAEWARIVWIEVVPQRKVGVGALQVFEAERTLRAVDELAVEQLLEAVFVILLLQLVDVE